MFLKRKSCIFSVDIENDFRSIAVLSNIKVRHLEENSSAMAEDLMRKAAVIQHYAMEAKIG